MSWLLVLALGVTCLHPFGRDMVCILLVLVMAFGCLIYTLNFRADVKAVERVRQQRAREEADRRLVEFAAQTPVPKGRG